MMTIPIPRAIVLLACFTFPGATAWAVQDTPGAEQPGVEATTEGTPDAAGGEDVATEPALIRDEVVRIGGDYTLPAGERVRDIVVISGSATIEGEVIQDLVVIMGQADLGATAVVGGDMVVIGGGADIAEGAEVDGDLVVFGDEIVLPAGFEPGGEQFLTETLGLGSGVLEFLPWVTRGLFWGRPIVPDLAWVWGVVGVFLAVYLVLNLVFDSATRACSTTISERPLSTLLAGLLALLLAGPVSFLLTVSVVGLLVIPFFWSALLVAGLIGKVGVLRWMGAGVLRQDGAESRGVAALAVVVGFALVTLAYMVPVLGVLTWATLSFFGLGAAAIAFVGALRRENPTETPAPVSARGGDRADLALDSAIEVGSEESSPGAPPPGRTPGAPPPGQTDEAPQTAPDAALFPRATFLIRLGAFMLDFFLAIMTFSLLGLSDVGRFLLLFLVYNIGFWSWKGATVGGIICQFRVVRQDGQSLTFSDALVRGLSSIFSFAALGLGCLWVLWDAEMQAWHDKIAGTYVVRVPRNWPLS